MQNMNHSANAGTMVVPTMHCSNYDPAPFMREYTYENGNRELYLEVKFRVDWYLHWCQENGITGMIDESDVKIMPEIGMVLATCVISNNDKVVAKATAGRLLANEKGPDPSCVQTACTCAKGRALANLGFGTVNGNMTENGDGFPPDSGIALPRITPQTNPMLYEPSAPVAPAAPIPVQPVQAAAVAPEVVTPTAAAPVVPTAEAPAEPVQKKRGRRKKEDLPAPVQSVDLTTGISASDTGAAETVSAPALMAPVAAPVDPAPVPAAPVMPVRREVNADPIPTTVDEAKAYKCPIGADSGKTMGEIWATNPNKIIFYGGDRFTSKDRYPALVAAAKLILATK